MTEKVAQCVGRVRGEGQWGSFDPRACTKPAKVERDGKHYCTTHDPVRRKERQDKSYEAYRQKIDAEIRNTEWERAACAVCSGVDTETMRKLGNGWLAKKLAGVQP